LDGGISAVKLALGFLPFSAFGFSVGGVDGTVEEGLLEGKLFSAVGKSDSEDMSNWVDDEKIDDDDRETRWRSVVVG
jgi:hypothetical protein